MTDWPAGWLAPRVYDDRVACWLSILQKNGVLIMDKHAELKAGIGASTYLMLDDYGKRYADFLLEQDAMPAELIYLLEQWVELPDYDPWTVNSCLRYVAVQFGYN